MTALQTVTQVQVLLPATPWLKLGPNGRLKGIALWREQKKLLRALEGTLTAVKPWLRELAASAGDAREIRLDWIVYWEPRRKKWDRDNFIAAMKPVQDQLARIMEINDVRFVPGSVEQVFDAEDFGVMELTLTLLEPADETVGDARAKA